MSKTIRQITRTKTTLDGTELWAGNDLSGDFKSEIDSIVDYIATGELDTYINGLAATAIATARRGTIQMWGAAAAPTGALLLQGQAVSRTTYADLFTIYGETFGVGDGSTTFNLPNFQGVVPKGVGSQTINTRSKSGPSLGALQEDQLQGHRHNIPDIKTITVPVASPTTYVASFTSGTPETRNVNEPITDGTNGTPRTGATTQENCLGINFIVWY